MTLPTLCYVLPNGAAIAPHVKVALDQLRPTFGDLLLVVPQGQSSGAAKDFAGYAPLHIVELPAGPTTTGAAYKAGLAALWAKGENGRVILTGAHVAGPLVLPDAAFLDPAASGAMLSSSYWRAPQLDLRLKGMTGLARLAYLDFAVVSADLMAAPWFQAFWSDFAPRQDYWDEFLRLNLKLAEVMAAQSAEVLYPPGADSFETADPRHNEVDKLVRHGMPCLPLSVFLLDPLLHDLEGIDLRAALDGLRGLNPDLYDAVIRFTTRQVRMRDFNTVADQYEVLPEQALTPGKTEWSFGRVAVFIHAFYAEMMPEFWVLIQRIPCDCDLFLTTSTDAHKAEIEGFLAAQGWPADRAEVRVVEQNRGRDMSSLFITFRDVILEDRYEVALRLHSKRTPQVSRQVGEGFKKHLFDNLVKSPGYVSNVLDLIEANPDIGMVMPPVIHIGFATLGHSWFNNRGTLASLSRDMGLNVPFDTDTPVAPYGTMYWFRTDALRGMFAWNWRWEDYNPEPHHVDGGLAHVQERLIGYVAQDAGYRIVQAMNPALAGRYYARLEYKMQLLSARLMSGNIVLQRDQLDHLHSQNRTRLFRSLQNMYGGVIKRFPALRGMLRPVARLAVRIISPKP